MAEVTLYKQDGKESGKVDLPDALFAVKVKPDVVHEVLVAQLANGRTRLAQTKDRSEVRGGGRKPWRQKGTGRARHGSRRSPIWSGGGVTFGPLAVKSFAKKVNKKVRRQALAMVLSDKRASDQLIAVESLVVADGKTKEMAALRSALPGAGYSTLFVTAKEEAGTVRAAKNLPKTQTIAATSLNVRDLLKAKYVVVSKAALEEIKATYLA